jgi:hypothetical protein
MYQECGVAIALPLADELRGNPARMCLPLSHQLDHGDGNGGFESFTHDCVRLAINHFLRHYSYVQGTLCVRRDHPVESRRLEIRWRWWPENQAIFGMGRVPDGCACPLDGMMLSFMGQ